MGTVAVLVSLGFGLPLEMAPLWQTPALAQAADAAEADRLEQQARQLYSQGRYAEAIPLAEQVVAIRKQVLGPQNPQVATALNNLALLYQDQGRYSEAEPLFQEAIAIDRQALPPNHPSLATHLNNLAGLYRAQGRYSEAEPLFQEAFAIVRQALPPNHPSLATHLNNLAGLYQDQGRYSEAEPLFQEAFAIVRQALPPNHPSLAKALNNLALLYWAQADGPRTLQFLAEGLDIEEDNLARNLAVGNEAQKRAFLSLFSGSSDAAISAHLQLAPPNPQAAQLALTTLLRRKGRILDVLGQSVQRLRQNLNPQLQALLDRLALLHTELSNLASRGPGSSPPQVQQVQQQLATFTTEVNQIEAALSRASAELRRELNPVQISAVQAVIPTDAALVEFVLYQPFNPKAKATERFSSPRYAAYVLGPTGEPRWADLGPTSELDPLIKNFRNIVQDPSSAPKVKSSARDLDVKLMQPVRALVGKAQHLLIAPDGPLNVIPFEALVDENNQFLLETYQITYLTSGRDLLRLQDPLSPGQAPLLLTYPAYDQQQLPPGQPVAQRRGSSQRSGDLSSLKMYPLEATIAEGQAIQPLLTQARLNSGPDATETLVKQSPSPRILHFATHGFFLDVPLPTPTSGEQPPPFTLENPLLRSGLALAGFNLRQSGPEDGVLTALEVSGLDFQDTQMVVLSACDTGVGEIVNGEGVYGLRRAFTLAGARSQLMSLWTVEDEGTKDLMVAYYQKLKQNQPRGAALRDAQRAMLEGKLTAADGSSYAHPHYWAAFVRVGDWRPLE
jgi:CHAT domain-containing protein/Tfp pilus assembly protein PilF